MGKYGNHKVCWEGQVFDSKKELNRWLELRLLERAGKIRGLKRQVKHELIPAQRDEAGKIIERPVTYIADFEYREYHGEDIAADMTLVVEDTKGFRTPEYIIKRKLMLYKYGIRIREV